jgi:serine/threonine protein kinase
LNSCVIKFYGITQDPVTKDYIMVLDYAENGNLRKYLDISYKFLSWSDKISYLHSIANGLKDIHGKELIHRDLHIGNILKLKYNIAITDMGLCKPADYNASENTKNVYGVLPYIAPEVLRGQKYTKAADIYSFGIIIYEVISGLPPYHDIKHEEDLARKICFGLRPRFNIKVPQLIIHLIKRCLDANSLNRPKTEEIEESLKNWFSESITSKFDNYTEIQKQIEESEEINNNLPMSIIPLTNLERSYETHTGAVYTSRLLSFNNLPQSKNSNDYYERYDNIISMEFSGIN